MLNYEREAGGARGGDWRRASSLTRGTARASRWLLINAGGRGVVLFESAASSRGRGVRVRELVRQEQSVEESCACATYDDATRDDETCDETYLTEARVAVPWADRDACAWQMGSDGFGSARISSARRAPFKRMTGHESFISPPLQQSIAEPPAASSASARVALAIVTQTSSTAIRDRAVRNAARRFSGRR